MSRFARILVLWNTFAGRDMRAREEAVLARCMRGLTCDLRESRAAGEVRQWAASAQAEGYELVVAAGGDGTIAEAAEGVIATGGAIPLGILPLGSYNALARSLGYPLSPEAAMRVVQSGEVRVFDAGYVVEHQRHFFVGAGIGRHARLMGGLPRQWKSSLGRGAYVAALVRAAMGSQAAQIEIIQDGQARSWNTSTVFVLNMGEFIPGAVELGRSIDPRDGMLDLLVLQRGRVVDLLAAYVSAIVAPKNSPWRLVHERAARIQLRARPPLPVQIDGELLGETPVTIETRRNALRIVVPQSIGTP